MRGIVGGGRFLGRLHTALVRGHFQSNFRTTFEDGPRQPSDGVWSRPAEHHTCRGEARPRSVVGPVPVEEYPDTVGRASRRGGRGRERKRHARGQGAPAASSGAAGDQLPAVAIDGAEVQTCTAPNYFRRPRRKNPPKPPRVEVNAERGRGPARPLCPGP